eukprot:4208835-Prymnesium_polylepis.1
MIALVVAAVQLLAVEVVTVTVVIVAVAISVLVAQYCSSTVAQQHRISTSTVPARCGAAPGFRPGPILAWGYSTPRRSCAYTISRAPYGD